MPTTKNPRPVEDELRAEYDFAALGPGVRGKYYEAARTGGNLVLLEPDVARAFPTSEAVNSALRLLVEVAQASSDRPRKKREAVKK